MPRPHVKPVPLVAYFAQGVLVIASSLAVLVHPSEFFHEPSIGVDQFHFL
ncbi:MAG: hypothetical protein WCA23_05390 [Stellaceae bacterium]|jgi:hypothetical protein